MTMRPSTDAADAGKRAAAEAALALVQDSMTIGLGTGSTANAFIDALGTRVREGLKIQGVPTSQATAKRALAAAIPLVEVEPGSIDLAVDGADEVGPGLALVKGGGGALLREKIVASNARRFVVIADASKAVAVLGGFPLPVEVVRFSWRATAQNIENALAEFGISAEAQARRDDSVMIETEEGNHIVDFACGRIADPQALHDRLIRIPGVVETGLFTHMAERAFLGGPDGVREITP